MFFSETMETFPKYVINLQRRFDRLQKFIKAYPLDDLRIVYGFDGKNIDKESQFERELCKKFSLSLGEKGCFITHMRIFSEIIQKNIPYALIMEDDVELCNNFNERFETVMKELTTDFDVLYIGGRFTPEYVMTAKNSTPITEHIVRHKREYTSEDCMDLDRTSQAYVISNRMAHLVYNSFMQWTNIIDGYDNWLMQTFLAHGIRVYSAKPLLCHAPKVSDNSDIR